MIERVDGFIEKRKLKEGKEVKKGDLMFVMKKDEIKEEMDEEKENIEKEKEDEEKMKIKKE